MNNPIFYNLFRLQKVSLLKKQSIKKSDLKDIYIVILLYILPSSFLALIPSSLFYIPGLMDLNLITWLLTLPLLIATRKRYLYVYRSKSGKLLFVVVFFVLIRFVFTLVQGTTFSEAFTVFRKLFYSPIACLALILYFQTLSLERIMRLFRWLFLLFIINVLLYIVNALGLHILPESRIDLEDVGGVSYLRTIAGFPIYYQVFLSLIIVKYFTTGERKILIWGLLGLLASIISATRGLIITTIVLVFILILFLISRLKKKYFSRLRAFTVILLISIGALTLFGGNILSFVSNKFQRTFNVELKDDSGTFAVRQRLIDESFSLVTKNNVLFLYGNGYIRPPDDVNANLVFGNDTHIAPVIFTEGIVGMIIRLLPILYFLFISLFSRKTKLLFEFKVIIIALIVANAIGYVQTSIFLDYTSVLIFFYIFELISKKYASRISENIHSNRFL